MGITGPPPKAKGTRARVNRDTFSGQEKSIEFVKGVQPPLPTGDGYPKWHPQTVQWWNVLGESPLAEHMLQVDWEYLLDTAVIHTEFWDGRVTMAADLARREHEFGVTISARMKLRITAAEAQEKESKRATTSPAANQWSDLRAAG